MRLTSHTQNGIPRALSLLYRSESFVSLSQLKPRLALSYAKAEHLPVHNMGFVSVPDHVGQNTSAAPTRAFVSYTVISRLVRPPSSAGTRGE